MVNWFAESVLQFLLRWLFIKPISFFVLNFSKLCIHICACMHIHASHEYSRDAVELYKLMENSYKIN